MKDYIYVDNSSTTKLSEKAYVKMLPFLREEYGNASTTYELGRKAREAVETAREKISKCLNVDKEEIYFVGSGTEADNMALRGIAHKNMSKGKHIITSKFEHSAILNTCKQLEKEGFEITYVDVEENGIIDVAKIKEAIKNDTILISIMYVNNEIGTIQKIDEIAKIARENNIIFHTDAVQAIPHIKIDASKYDALSISAHKFNGPKGIGVLYLNKNVQVEPIIFGGHQEKGLRPGTENVSEIVGMAEALEQTYINMEKNNCYERKLRDYLLNNILESIPGVSINGDLDNRICSNINISIDGINTSDLMVFLDMEGICATTSSACNSGHDNITHVMKAIGHNTTSLRMTVSKDNTFEEMDKIVKVIKNAVEIIKRKDKTVTKG